MPLLVPILILGIFSMIFLGRKAQRIDKEKAMKDIEEPKGLSPWSVWLPFVVLVFLLVAPRIWPFDFPVFGLPLTFALSSLVAWLFNYRRVNIIKVSKETVAQLTPLLATTAVVGMLIQIMSMNGVKGLVSMWVVTAPLTVVWILLPFIIPVSEGLLTYGAATVLGIPLIWMLNSRGINPVLVLSGLSLMWPLGDGLPPTALIGRLTVNTVGYKGAYGSFLKECIVPWIAITVVGMILVIFANSLDFLMLAG